MLLIFFKTNSVTLIAGYFITLISIKHRKKLNSILLCGYFHEWFNPGETLMNIFTLWYDIRVARVEILCIICLFATRIVLCTAELFSLTLCRNQFKKNVVYSKPAHTLKRSVLMPWWCGKEEEFYQLTAFNFSILKL